MELEVPGISLGFLEEYRAQAEKVVLRAVVTEIRREDQW